MIETFCANYLWQQVVGENSQTCSQCSLSRANFFIHDNTILCFRCYSTLAPRDARKYSVVLTHKPRLSDWPGWKCSAENVYEPGVLEAFREVLKTRLLPQNVIDNIVYSPITMKNGVPHFFGLAHGIAMLPVTGGGVQICRFYQGVKMGPSIVFDGDGDFQLYENRDRLGRLHGVRVVLHTKAIDAPYTLLQRMYSNSCIFAHFETTII